METREYEILITGAGGWLGSELTSQLLQCGKRVRALNYAYTDSLKQLKERYMDQLDIVLGDICDTDLINTSLKGIQSVFHLAAKVHVIPINKQEEDEFFKTNTDASKNIFEKCLNNNVKRIIFFSTVSVYSQTNEMITTSSEKKPTTIYGKSKLQAEEIANEMYARRGLPITIVEPVTVYGEGDVGNFRKLENLIKKGICIRFGNGQNKKTIIYYKDLIKMVIKLSEDDSYIGKTVICGTEVLTVNEINEILSKKYKKRIFKLTIPSFISTFIVKTFNFSKLKKIKRKVMALTQNNEFEINNILDQYTSFKGFQLK